MSGYREIQAVVLRSQDLREADRRLTLLTPAGRTQARVPGARKAKSRLAGLLQPGSLVQVTLYERTGMQPVVTGASQIAAFRRLHEDLGRMAATQVLLEICDVQSGEEEAMRPFATLVQALRLLDEAEDSAAAWLQGELGLLAAYGWGIELTRCVGCGGELRPPLRYQVEFGGFTCGHCAMGGVAASEEALRALRAASAGTAPGTGAAEARRLLHLTWQAHLEAPLRSAAFAESVFGA
jgi:DNA repair protein RecO (recombination protein O)